MIIGKKDILRTIHNSDLILVISFVYGHLYLKCYSFNLLIS